MTRTVAAVSMFKDEGDVAYDVLCHMADEVGLIIVADNLSDDNTLAELIRAREELSRRAEIVILNDGEVGYYQSRKMTSLAQTAVEYGAEWIVPFDADELWYCHEDRIDLWLGRMGPEVTSAQAQLWNHFGTALDAEGDSPFQRMIWRQNKPGALPKVAFRWQEGAVIAQGNHDVFLPQPGQRIGGLELRHFPYRSFEHFKRKAANGARAYAATDLPLTEGAHWRGYGEILERHGEDALREVFETYFWFLSPVDEGMVRDPAPFMRWRP